MRRGFTIVELLIVIVVIGILAAISLIAYGQVSSLARDSDRKQDLATLAKVTQLYRSDKGDLVRAGCGTTTAGSEGSGWLSSDYDGAGSAVSIYTCLINNNNLQRAIVDPSGLQSCSGATCHAYLKASCAAGTWYLANLEQLAQNSTFTDDKCFSLWDTEYGVNYAVKVD
ncbi:MAG: type II secretion system protein [Candidatus Saccharimonadales bacterium]